MSRQDELSTWTHELSNRMPHLSKSQVVVLAMFSFAITVTRLCGRTTVAAFLAMLLGKNEDAIEQRLQEWCCDAKDKSGKKRRDLDVTTCFVPLLAWIVSLWTGTAIALAVDATSLGERFVVLTVSVVYRGTGIPVAWTVLPGQQKGAWRGHWLRMLDQLKPAIPSDWLVLVLADRGLYAPWLFQGIVRLGWHPFLRVNRGAKFRPDGQKAWYWLMELIPGIGSRWRGQGTAFPSRHPLKCTLVAWWGEGHDEPWFILTDLPAESCDAAWYALRVWCEQGFKCYKRGGWQWQYTRMTDPARVARVWLALAVANLWAVTLGSELETGSIAEASNLPELRSILSSVSQPHRRRRLRLFRLGWLLLLVQLITAQSLPLPRRLLPEPWPDIPDEWRPSLIEIHQKALAHVLT